MTEETPIHYINVPEAVGVFSSRDTFQAAIYDLMIAGFSRFDISVLASEDTVREKLGAGYWTADKLADHPDAPRTSFVSEEWVGELEGYIFGGFFFIGSAIAMLAMLNPLSTLAGSVAVAMTGGGPGALIGGALARRLGKKHAENYENQLRRGGILLWVRTNTPEKEELATKIMEGHSGRDVHVHPWSEA